MAKAKRRRYKTPKTILRKALDYFKANPDNWTKGQYRRKLVKADDGVALCALGACNYFAEDRKLGNAATRYLAEAMGMKTAHTAKLEDVQRYVYFRNDGKGGKKKVINALERAVA